MADQNNNNSDLLACLGESLKIDKNTGPEIDLELAEKVNTLMSTGVLESKTTELKDMYVTPGNCPFLVVPKCPSEIWNTAGENIRGKDLKLQKIQTPLIKGITANTLLMNDIVSSMRGKRDMPPAAGILLQLSNSASLLAATNALINNMRKDMWRN